MHKVYENFNDLRTFIELQKRSEKKQNLSYMYSLCDFFGNPQKEFKSIHVGGTNGKGSTVTFIKSILLSEGYNVGTYISPYVVCFNERITLNDEYISNEDFIYYGNLVVGSFGELEKKGLRTPSFFEIMTLIAFLYFRDKKVDFAVIEVGIGGTLDATNVIDPIASVVASVSYDHMDILGSTLPEIWSNKLGIAKPFRPFITFNNPEFNDQIKEHCKQVNAKLIRPNKNDIQIASFEKGLTTFQYLNYEDLKIRLMGKHQVENAVLAISVIQEISKSYQISLKAIYQGLYKAFWPGRLEILSDDPLIIIDGAHNIDGITRLNEFINTINDKKIRLIFAVSSNKEKDKMIELIEQSVDEIIFTHFMYKRSDESINLFNLSKHKNKSIDDDLNHIIELVRSDKEKITIFCGSLFFISEVRTHFK